MQLPSDFKTLIEDNFYDKEVEIYNSVQDVDEELSVSIKKGNKKETIKCNVHFIGNKAVQQDYGLDIDANILITCEKTIAKKGDITNYLGSDYIITEILNPDSHIKIFAKTRDI